MPSNTYANVSRRQQTFITNLRLTACSSRKQTDALKHLRIRQQTSAAVSQHTAACGALQAAGLHTATSVCGLKLLVYAPPGALQAAGRSENDGLTHLGNVAEGVGEAHSKAAVKQQ